MSVTFHKMLDTDLNWCLRRLPFAARSVLQTFRSKVFLAGGFIRSCIAREEINDVDLFVGSKESADAVMAHIILKTGVKPHITKNAMTFRTKPYSIQIITRWMFDTPEECAASFDFTVARAVVYCENGPSDPEKPGSYPYEGIVDQRFYADLSARRLTYTVPDRNEDAGGSMLRVLKFYRRDYLIPMDSLAAVIARLVKGVRHTETPGGLVRVDGRSDADLSKVLCGLLREVDPAIDPARVAHMPAENAKAETEENSEEQS